MVIVPVSKFVLNPGVFKSNILKALARSVQLNVLRFESFEIRILRIREEHNIGKHKSHNTTQSNCNEFVIEVNMIVGLSL